MTVVVMTGGTSGIGAYAVRQLVERGHRVVLGARAPKAADADRGTRRLPLDLADLGSVREFADQVRDVLGGEAVGAFVGNAGLSFTHADARTAQGWEATFGVNHLGHYLLLRLLDPELPAGARVVLTTSGVHDPDEHAPIPAPRHADARLLATPAADPELHTRPSRAGGHAYSASKLCNLLTVRQLRTVRPDLQPVAFDPGPTPGTNLSRSYRAPMRLAWSVLGGPIGRLVPGLSRAPDVGRALADLVEPAFVVPPDSYYLRMRRGEPTWARPSVLARDDRAAADLWDHSADLVELSTLG